MQDEMYEAYPPEKKKMSGWLIALIVVVALLIICCLCLCVTGLLFGPAIGNTFSTILELATPMP